MKKLAKYWGRVLLKIGVFILCLEIVFLGFFAWAIFFPDTAWRLIGKRFVPKDLQVDWRKLDFKPEKLTLLHYKGELLVEGLNVRKGKPALELPIDSLALRYDFSIWKPRTFIQLFDLKVRASQTIWFKSEPGPVEAPKNSPYEWSQMILKRWAVLNSYADIESIDVEVDRFELRGRGDPLVIAGSVKSAARRPVDVILDVRQGNFNGRIVSDLQPRVIGGEDAFIETGLDLKGPNFETQTKLSARYNLETLRLSSKGPLTITTGEKKITMHPIVSLQVHKAGWSLTGASVVNGLPRPLHEIPNLQIEIRTPEEAGELFPQAPSTFKASASLGLLSVKEQLLYLLNKNCNCKWPERRQVESSGKFWLRNLLYPEKKLQNVLDGSVKVEPTHNRLIDLALSGGLQIFSNDGVLSYAPSLDSSLKIKSFQSLKEILVSNGVLVPAPFDVMEGTVDLIAKSPVSLSERGSQTKVDFKTDLKSKRQDFLVDGSGDFKLNRALTNLDINLEFLFKKVMLELPPLDPVLGLPPLVRDSRVMMQPPLPPKERSDFKMKLTIAASTQSEGAIKMLSPLADPYLPLTIEARRTNDGDVAGFIKIEPFKVKYLKRVMAVENLRLVFDQRDNADYSVDGRVRFDTTDCKVYADISGTLASPIVRLRSEPELGRSDIISVLLYDRTSDQLVGGDKETASSFEAALMDRAIGLFGLWAFASTPIRSFQYNPVSKVYTATVQLPNQVTAAVGTDWERSAQLELRKRVTRQWVLSASWSPGERESSVGKLVLQWEKRF